MSSIWIVILICKNMKVGYRFRIVIYDWIIWICLKCGFWSIGINIIYCI